MIAGAARAQGQKTGGFAIRDGVAPEWGGVFSIRDGVGVATPSAGLEY